MDFDAGTQDHTPEHAPLIFSHRDWAVLREIMLLYLLDRSPHESLIGRERRMRLAERVLKAETR